MNVYFISGLGANCSVFDEISLPEKYNKVYLEWKIPHEKESLEDYVYRLSSPIHFEEDFILVGLSFGGIIAQEISKIKAPKKLILISSIKAKHEIPRLFKFSKFSAAHKVIPISFFTSDQVISYAFFRKLYSKHLPKLSDVFTVRDPQYLRWSMDKIVNWEPSRNIEDTELYHIHGTKDPLFPIKKMKNIIEIPNGNHLMIKMKSKEIENRIQEIL